jgi:hypothetical protein
MRIECAEGDAPAFLAQVEALAYGIALQMKPAFLVLVKVDNWFGPNWLPFSAGTRVPARGVEGRFLHVPLFVPNRVISERRFDAPQYEEAPIGRSVHAKDVEDARQRRVSDLPRDSTLIWYSGGSTTNKRGSVLAYVAVGDLYKAWYAGWSEGRCWHVDQAMGIDVKELSGLIDAVV